MKKFLLKPEIHFGRDALSYLKEIEAKHVFIVTDPFMVKLGILDKITALLDHNKIYYHVFSETEPDPSTETIQKGLEHIIYAKPDMLIAVGGGSSIDAAKAIMYMCIQVKEKFIDKDSIHKPWFIAIPTTSGTGSEVSSYSVITDKATHAKILLKSAIMLPDVALLDESLTMSVPPPVTADTGFDVLTHSIEAYVSPWATDYTDIFAEKAMKLVFSYLLKAYKKGDDEEARHKLHNASCMAGIAFTNASLGINHSLAHAIGGEFNFPHGRSNAMFLPYVIAYNAGLDIAAGTVENAAVAQRYAQLAICIGLPAQSPFEGTLSLITAIKVLKSAVNIPHTIRELHVSEEDFKKRVAEMAANAEADICTSGNPIAVTRENLTQLYLQAFYGE